MELGYGASAPTAGEAAGGSVDLEGLRRLVRWQLENGPHGISIGGSTGAPSALSLDERITAMEAVSRLVADRVPFRCLPAGPTEGIGERVRFEDPLGFTVELFGDADRVDRLTQRNYLRSGAEPATWRARAAPGSAFTPSVSSPPRPTTSCGPAISFAATHQEHRLERGAGRRVVSNAVYIYLRDPDGHRVEICTSAHYTGDPGTRRSAGRSATPAAGTSTAPR